MTNTTHTPGPWRHDFGQHDAAIHAGGTIAMIDDTMIGWRANARLIAAAPELLAALEALARWETCDLDAEQAAALMDEVCDMARAAIAKAKGK